jgi:hypothetical protein
MYKKNITVNKNNRAIIIDYLKQLPNFTASSFEDYIPCHIYKLIDFKIRLTFLKF